MHKNWQSPKLFTALVFVAIVIISFLFSQIITGSSVSFAIVILLGIVIVVITLIKTDIALVILIFSMLLSPELSVGGVPGRDIVLRIDDILIGLIILTWLAKMAYKKGLSFFLKTPLNKAIGLYFLICIISTLRGAYLGYVLPVKGLFYVLRYGEYFLLFILVANHVQSKKQVKYFLTFLFITCTIVSLYGILQIPSGKRVSAPFEGRVGEPNTMGGYLLIILFIAIGILLQNVPKRLRLTLLGLSVLIFIPFLFTLSRSSYVAFVFSLLALIVLSKKKVELVAVTTIIFLIVLVLNPQAVFLRVKYTFEGPRSNTARYGGSHFDPSAAARITSWKDSIKAWTERPILGRGVSGFAFIDGQYIRTLPELGILGFLALLWLLWTILKHSYKIYREMDDELFKGLALGYIAGFIGLMAHALTSNTFIIIRIMEPFWFLTGMVIVLPILKKEEPVSDFLESK